MAEFISNCAKTDKHKEEESCNLAHEGNIRASLVDGDTEVTQGAAVHVIEGEGA